MSNKSIAGVKRIPEPEEPVQTHPPTRVYAIERDGVGWRTTFYDVPPAVLVQHQTQAWEPDLKGLAMDRIMRDIEERSR